MALVPFSVSGPAASQDLVERLLQVGPYSLVLRQRPRASGNTAHLDGGGSRSQRCGEGDDASAGSTPQQQGQQQQQQPDLSNVGLVLWQSGFLLADLLLPRQPPALSAAAAAAGGAGWAGVRVLELGSGGGTVGMFLAAAGAQVVLTDQAHILPLTRENLALNFSSRRQSTAPAVQQQEAGPTTAPRHPSVVAALAAAFSSGGDAAAAPGASAGAEQLAGQVFAAGPLVVAYEWGEPLSVLHSRIATVAAERCPNVSAAAAAASGLQVLASSGFDVIVGADLLYDASGHAPLLASLEQLSTHSPHARVLLAWRCRGLGEEAFVGAAEAAGWVVEAVPAGQLHPEFQDGSYRAVCMVRLPP